MDRFDRAAHELCERGLVPLGDGCRYCVPIAAALRAEHARGQKVVDAAKAVLDEHYCLVVGGCGHKDHDTLRAAIAEWEQV